MNSTPSHLDNLDASNRAMGLFAGVTGEAYERIGLGHSGASLLDTLLKAFSSPVHAPAANSDEAAQFARFDYALRSTFGQDFSALKTSILESESPGALQALAEGISLSSFPVRASYSDPSRMDDMQDWLSSGATPAADIPVSGASSPLGEPSVLTESSAPSVFDLLSALTPESSDLSGDFDGQRQRLIRDFIDDLGQRSDSSIRDFLQTEVRGELKGALQSAVESLGVEALDPVSDPVFAVDYYGESATLINGTLESSSLSSVALPPIGPSITALTDQLLPH